MSHSIQIIVIIFIALSTLLIYKSFGPHSGRLLFTREDKKRWDVAIAGQLGNWLTINNIFGTLTSMATVYLFFIGNAKLFGLYIFVCPFALMTGVKVTNAITKKFMSLPRYSDRLAKSELVSGVIASLCWDVDSRSKAASFVVKWVSIMNLAGIIWLEFALFSDIMGKLSPTPTIYVQTLIMFLITLMVVCFTLYYGLRGFVFIDLFHAPLIGVSVVVLFIGTVWLVSHGTPLISQVSTDPILPVTSCILFAIHVLILNTLIVATTESHWLRVWAFGERESSLQLKGVAIASGITIVLILCGFVAFAISGKPGDESVVSLIRLLSDNVSSAFGVVFLVGGLGALFSTADSQIYGILVVSRFDIATGQMRQLDVNKRKTLSISFLISLCFTGLYYMTRLYQIPFDKIIFMIIPMSLNVLPAIACALFGRQQSPVILVISVFLYLLTSTIGWMRPSESFEWSLSSALVPFVLSFVAVKLSPRGA